MTLCYSHKREDPFCRFDKRIVFDSSISLKAKGLLSIAFSRPENWKFYKSEMMKHCSDGRYSFDSGIDELEAAGYLHRINFNNPENGQFEWEWHFYEVPISDEEFKKSLPDTGFQHTDKSNMGKPASTKKEEENKKEEKESVVDRGSTSDKNQNFKEISFRNSKNEREKIDETKLYSKIVHHKKDWTGEEINYAINALNKSNVVIYDWFKFFEGTIRNLRLKNKSEQICKQTGNKNKSNKKNESMMKKKNSSENSTETPTSRKFPIWGKSKIYQDYLNGCLRPKTSS